MRSYDNQFRQDDERSVDINDGAYMCAQVLLKLCVCDNALFQDLGCRKNI